MPVRVEELIRRSETLSASDAAGNAVASLSRWQHAWAEPGMAVAQALAEADRHVLSRAIASPLAQARTAVIGLDGAVATGTAFALASERPAWMEPSMSARAQLSHGAVLNEVANAARALRFPWAEFQAVSGGSSAALAVATRDSGVAQFPITGLAGELTAMARLADLERFHPSQAFVSGLLQRVDVAIDLGARLLPSVLGIGPAAWDAVAVAPAVPWLEPGTPDGDLFLLMRGDADPAQQLAALGRMANRVPWAPRPAAWNALVKRARTENTSVDTIKRQELQAAIVIVLGAVDQLHYYRFGREWLKGDDGHKVAVTPLDLELDRIWKWFYNEVRKAAEAALLEVPYPHVTRDVFHRKGSDGQRICLPFDPALLPEPANDPLDFLLDRERRTEDEERLLAVLKRASPGQRQLLALIAEGNTEAAAAQRLGIAPSTARVQLYRLRKKVV